MTPQSVVWYYFVASFTTGLTAEEEPDVGTRYVDYFGEESYLSSLGKVYERLLVLGSQFFV